jgi:hypothetical protein
LVNSILGGTSSSWGTLWITTHAAACANASKPCLLEECKQPLSLETLYYIIYSFNLTDTTQSATATNVQLLRADGNQLRCRPLAWLAICFGSMVTRFRAAIAKPHKMAIRSTLTQVIGRVLLRTILQLSMLYMGRTLGHD